MGLSWKRALIIGASSGMGAELALQLAQSGCEVAAVARRGEELEKLAASVTGTSKIRYYTHDVCNASEVPELIQLIAHDMGGFELFIYCAGVMPRITPDEYCFEKDKQNIEVNLLGAIAWINEAAQRFERAGEGTIVGISSVAGDRGRKGMPSYCASKAGLNTYLESIRNRVGRSGVAVVTIKPGPVDTPMTKGLDKLPMLISSQEAVSQILSAARRRAHTVYIPGKWRPIMWVIRAIPSFIFKKLNV